MNFEKLNSILESEPKYRTKQVWRAVFVDLVEDWNNVTTLPEVLRKKLNEEAPLKIEGKIFESKNTESKKALLTLEDGLKVETVLLFHRDGRHTVCVSSQVGCSLGCKFCATGRLGRKRNLTVGEIVVQVLFWSRYLKSDKKRVSNIVFMGMGEPFLNYDNVMQAIRILNNDDGLNIGARHISVSTSGIIEGIEKFTNEPLQLNLAISLHAPNEELRSELMPINKKYHLQELLEAVAKYVETTSRQVMFEYLMIDGVNDTEWHAKELAKIIDHPLYVVNLIRYNPTGVFSPSTVASIRRFKNILLRNGVKVTQRQTFGQDVDAACGQLAMKNKGNY